jgi:5'-methylthioadenosine phosphorylase
MTFFEKGIVAHVSFADPICPDSAQVIKRAANELGFAVHHRGTYINMEGPAFSTRAESNLYRSWGMDIIGMTNMAEAKLAREAQICFVTLAAITDYDCWYNPVEEVSVEMVIQNLLKNVDNAKRILKRAVKNMPDERLCKCGHALKDALITDKKAVPAKVKKELKIIIGKYIS